MTHRKRMVTPRLAWIVLHGGLGLTGCGSIAAGVDLSVEAAGDLGLADGAVHGVGGPDLAASRDGAVDGGALASCNVPGNLSRGVAWVRSHPMMVSALSVGMGSPSLAAVNEYFDVFGANTVHLWANGLPTEIAGWNAAARSDFRYIAWLQPDGTSVTNGLSLGGAAPLPGRIGYQIGDEPQDATSLQAMLAGAALVRAADPDALTIINVNVAGNTDALRAPAITSANVDVLSYDHYNYGRTSYASLAKVRASALAAGKPYWRYLRSYYNKGGTPESTEADLRWDAFIGAAYGYTGHTWFIYQIDASNPDLAPLLFSAAGGYDAPKAQLYPIVATLNAELKRLGSTLSLLRSVDVRYVSALPLSRPENIEEWQKGAGGDPYLTSVVPAAGSLREAVLGFFRDDCDEPYVILQNAGHPGAPFPNGSAAPVSFHVELDFASAGDPTLDPSALVSLDLSSGATTSIPLSGSGTLRSVDLVLPAGGAVLWKYKTARSLVHQ